MSLFGSILSKIFHHKPKGAAPAPSRPAQPAPAPAPAPTPQAAPTPAALAPAPAPAQSVDVEAVLQEMASDKGETGLNWRTSIVDLLKLLDLDSSLSARKELAQELGVRAGADGSAEQNMALQKAVMRKLAENGGQVPASLRD